MKLKLLFAFLVGILTIHAAKAQKKGSFDVTINFNGSDRVLSCYVPTDYDSTIAMGVMIGLHGSGDNSANFSNAVIGNLQWNKIFTNTIFVFPDEEMTIRAISTILPATKQSLNPPSTLQ